jgi:hypothetical protein
MCCAQPAPALRTIRAIFDIIGRDLFKELHLPAARVDDAAKPHSTSAPPLSDRRIFSETPEKQSLFVMTELSWKT